MVANEGAPPSKASREPVCIPFLVPILTGNRRVRRRTIKLNLNSELLAPRQQTGSMLRSPTRRNMHRLARFFPHLAKVVPPTSTRDGLAFITVLSNLRLITQSPNVVKLLQTLSGRVGPA